ncbi:MAG: phospholipase [Planctomycetaceae bacterium]|nr:phospholipase [Planctomycetaceae bacterium]
MNRFLVVSLTLVATSSFRGDVSCNDGGGSQQAIKPQTEGKQTLGYLLYLPRDYDQQKSWPLVLFLHGSGERGGNLELVKKHGPPKRIAAGKHFPFIVVSPQCPRGRRWKPVELVSLLDAIGGKYRVDADRIYVTGLSMGGAGTWDLAAFAAQRLAAIAPICGGGDRKTAQRFAHLPVWAFHGAKDTARSLARTQEMIAALKEQGGKPKLTIYPDAGHDAWTATYNNPAFYTWLLEHKRVEKK